MNIPTVLQDRSSTCAWSLCASVYSSKYTCTQSYTELDRLFIDMAMVTVLHVHMQLQTLTHTGTHLCIYTILIFTPVYILSYTQCLYSVKNAQLHCQISVCTH